jgi:S1-C subfamily serine protease
VRLSEPTIDLAICDLDCPNPKTLTASVTPRQRQGDSIILAGFPNYQYGDTPHIAPGVIVQARTRSTIERLVIDTPIVKGNSGGPVINPDGAVIGVAVTGTDRADNVHDTVDYGVIPIAALKHLDPTLTFNPFEQKGP